MAGQGRIRLPKQWSQHFKSGVLHAISLAHFSLTYTRSWAANSWNARIRLKQENDRLQQELAGTRDALTDSRAEVAALREQLADAASRESALTPELASLQRELEEKLGRNDPCPCGSGKRFKSCCLKSGRF